MQTPSDLKNLLIALLLSVAILFVWQATYEAPRREQALRLAQQAKQDEAAKPIARPKVQEADEATMPRAQRLAASPRLAVASDKLHGSLSLKGLRLDDLTLAQYRTAIDPNSAEMVLLSPAGDAQAYFAEIGWAGGDPALRLPDANTLWRADRATLTPESPVTLAWDNGQGVVFQVKLALDKDYLFTLEQKIVNRSGQAVSAAPYALLNRAHVPATDNYAIMHEGPLGVMAGTLEEIPYGDLEEKGKREFKNASGWFGITDKYWLAALIPQDRGYQVNYSRYESKKLPRYQVDYLGEAETVAPGGESTHTVRLFAGAKELNVLDRYTERYGIPLFDRAVDFGWLYFLTKPIFLTLTYFYSHIGNFGVAILLLTVIIKGLMFPLANKSYKAMGQMKRLTPEMNAIRERYKDDKVKMNQAIMELYRKEKVNPASGCLPLLVQLPVFFALYKVLFVTIEMRHAPFFGWLVDLSSPDPSNLFTLFGLIPWTPPGMLHIGVLPLVMCITMIVQQKLSPPAADPVQAKIMSFLPYFFLFLFASFPAGLVLYWAWSNLLSILQQWVITRRHGPKRAQKIQAAS